MTLRLIRIGADEEGPELYRELAVLVGFYLQGRHACGETTTVSALRDAFSRFVEEIDEQMAGPEERLN